MLRNIIAKTEDKPSNKFIDYLSVIWKFNDIIIIYIN